MVLTLSLTALLWHFYLPACCYLRSFTPAHLTAQGQQRREDLKDNIVFFSAVEITFSKDGGAKLNFFVCQRKNKLAADYCHDCYDDFTLLLQHSTAADNSADKKQAEAKKLQIFS